MNCCLSLAAGLLLLALTAFVAGNQYAHVSLMKEQRKLDCSNSKVWCQSVRNALACNTLDHCMKAVWSKQKTTQPISTTICEECIELMETLKSNLSPNSSKAVAEKVINALCWAAMSEKAICELIIHVSFDKIYDMLNASVQNEEICNSLPFCLSNAKHDLVQVQGPNQIANSCPKCFDFIESAKNRFVSKSIDMKRSFFSRLIPRLCILTVGNQDFCFGQNFSMKQLDMISNLVEEHILNQEMCRYTSLCLDSSSSSTETSIQSIHVSQSSTECDMCKIIFHNVQQLLVTNSSFEKFKMNVEKLCSKLIKNADICNKDLDKYLTVVYNTMKEPSFPDLVCTLMDVCIKSTYRNPFISSNIDKKSEPEREPEASGKVVARKEIDFGDQMEIPDEERMRKLYRCHFVAFIKESMDRGRDNQGVKDDFTSVCGQIPSLVHSKNCKNFYEKELDQVIVLVRSNDIVSKRCAEDAAPFLVDRDQENAVDSKEDCLVCHLLMSKLKKMLNNNKTVMEFETYLKKACMVVKEEKLREECDRFVDTYGEKLMLLVNNKIVPKYICKELKICNSETIDALRRKVDDCDVCAQSTKALSQHMSDRMFNVSDATQLMAVCNDVPQKNVVGQCKKMMKTFGKSFVVLMQQNFSPLEVCYRTGLCAQDVNQRPSECFTNFIYALQSTKNALLCNNIAQFLIHHEIII